MKKLALVGLVLASVLALGSARSVADSGNLQPLTDCLQHQHSLSALFVMDTSQSLVQTDPRAERVAGLQAALASLSALASSATDFHVYTDFLEFGTTSRRAFPETPPWQALSDQPADQAAISASFAKKTKSEDTDYVAAFQPWTDPADLARPPDEIGALKMLKMAPEGSCRLVVWFTDGIYEIDYQGHPKTLNWTVPPTPINSRADGKAVLPQAVNRLCDAGGLADQLRTGDITTGSGAEMAVVALDTTNANFDLIRAVAVGQGTGGPCGAQPARGTFVSATNISQLVFGLRAAVLGASQGPAAGETGIATCDANAAACSKVGQVENFDYPFEITPGITGCACSSTRHRGRRVSRQRVVAGEHWWLARSVANSIPNVGCIESGDDQPCVDLCLRRRQGSPGSNSTPSGRHRTSRCFARFSRRSTSDCRSVQAGIDTATHCQWRDSQRTPCRCER